MLCLPLHVDTTTFGTLSLYADTPRAFKDVHRIRGAGARRARGHHPLRVPRRRRTSSGRWQSRDLIGQAKGIIMHAHRVTADEAFALLVRRSQETNTKLVDVAEAVVTTGIVVLAS